MALRDFTRTVALEVGPHIINVNALHAGSSGAAHGRERGGSWKGSRFGAEVFESLDGFFGSQGERAEDPYSLLCRAVPEIMQPPTEVPNP